MNQKIVAICATAMLATTVAASASGPQEDGWMRRRATGVAIRRIEQRLNITDAQRSSIKQILKTEQPAMEALAQQVRKQNEELASRPEFDEAEIRAFAREHEATMEDVLVEREKVRSELLQVLTPQQREQLKQIRSERRGELVEKLSNLADQI